jgi:hypothetical protein
MMSAKKMKKLVTVAVALFVGLGSVALAQAPGGERGERGDRGGRGERFDPERMRARMDEFMRTQLGATEEEWQVLSPLVRDVNEKRRETMGGMGRMMGRRGGPDGRGGPGGSGAPGGPEGPEGAAAPPAPPGGPEAEANPEAAALQKALADENTPAAEIQAKLEAYRKAQAVKEVELKEARDKLRAAVTARQEAILVLMGTLD